MVSTTWFDPPWIIHRFRSWVSKNYGYLFVLLE